MKRCRCLIERRIRGMLPVRFHQARLTDFSGAMQKAVTEWIAKPSDGLLLQGGVGAGKTHAVSAIVRLLMESRAEVKFTRAADFYARVRETYSQNGNPEQLTEAGVIGEFSTVRFCVLDDLGSGNLSDHERRCTLELLDQRLNALLPTIVTTNWSLKEISERMDERIASRLSGYTLLAFKGEDRRQK